MSPFFLLVGVLHTTDGGPAALLPARTGQRKLGLDTPSTDEMPCQACWGIGTGLYLGERAKCSTTSEMPYQRERAHGRARLALILAQSEL